jgi:L-asparaginase II
MDSDYVPVLEVTRGKVCESIHFGAAALVDSSGSLLASLGNPHLVTFMRSSAKPLQVLSFIENGGDQVYHLTSRELAIMCASHEGSDEHLQVIKGIQERVGLLESDLLCGIHQPSNLPAQTSLLQRGEAPTQNHNNCSGKHTGMLAYARMRGFPLAGYLDINHPIQQIILATVAQMCGLPIDQVELGTDGCSAPNFAIPLFNAALGFARLCDSRSLVPERSTACRRVVAAMMANPVMVSGRGQFDTRLMEACEGRLVAKGGAEGYYALGILPSAIGPGSPGVGLALKIADGDNSIHKTSGETYNRARPAVVLEILRQMGYITHKELDALAGDFGPTRQVLNLRKLVVGETRPVFTLHKEASVP